MIPHSHPVLTCAEAKTREATLLPDEDSEWSAMQRAGAGVAAMIADDFREIGGIPQMARVLVLAGKGNNGGDAFLAARALLKSNQAATAQVLLVYGESALRPLARRSFEELRRTAGDRVSVTAGAAAIADGPHWDLCLDGIFGFQFRPPLDAVAAAVIAQINAHSSITFRAAVDLPSGVSEEMAQLVFRADFTYATGIVKAPALRPENAASVGRLRYLDLGLVDDATQPAAPDRILTAASLQPLRQLRPAHSDKRSFGHLLIVGGSHGYPGAVVMAARAALHSGTGLVTAFAPEEFVPGYAAQHPEVMWVGCPVNAAGGLDAATFAVVQSRIARANALLVGPGLGADPATIALAGELVGAAKVPVVIDADALRPEVLARARRGAFICTPHAGEFKRIAGERSPVSFCADTGAVLVLKGAITRVVADAISHHSLFGGPVLARGGSGDILAGLTGGLLAQHPDAPALAAARGVIWHGRAADLLARSAGQVAVETTQLLDQLGAALRSG